jgi:multisubunit Na+/H+ antiporter MnhB subunit
MEDNQKKPVYEEYNASLDPDDPVSTMSEDELQESILEDSNMNGFQKWIARLDEKTWTLLQRIVGAIMGVATGVSLFWNGGSDNEQGFSWSLIVAVVIAMLIPNIIEKQGLRRIPKLRVALVIALGVMIVGYFVYWGAFHGFRLTN